VALRERYNFRITVGSVLMAPTLTDNVIPDVIKKTEGLNVPLALQLLDFSLFYFKGVDEDMKKKMWITEQHQSQLEELIDTLVKIKKDKPGLIENSIASLYYIKRYFRDPKGKDIPCYLAFGGKIWVDPQGKVYSCQGLPAVGDLGKTGLNEIIHSVKWRQRLYRMFKKDCPGCTCMYSSNVDAHLPLAWKDIARRKLSIENNT
jgi:MoaA/NifB/PqqE/SkfB family radical SAM enzyme